MRDVLIEAGYKEGQPLPSLTDEQVIETSWRYIDAFERITGQTFDFGHGMPIRLRILRGLVSSAMLQYYGCVVPIGASKKDEEHWSKMKKAMDAEGIPYSEPFYASAHKETRRVLEFVEQMDRDSMQPLVYVTFAGRSNGLGPVVAGNTRYPVITCPPFSDTAAYSVDIHSSLRMPGNLPMATIVDPGNAVLFAKRILESQKIE